MITAGQLRKRVLDIEEAANEPINEALAQLYRNGEAVPTRVLIILDRLDRHFCRALWVLSDLEDEEDG